MKAVAQHFGQFPGPKCQEPDLRRLQMAKWKVLNRLKTSAQRWKTPCYVGLHPTVAQLVELEAPVKILVFFSGWFTLKIDKS